MNDQRAHVLDHWLTGASERGEALFGTLGIAWEPGALALVWHGASVERLTLDSRDRLVVAPHLTVREIRPGTWMRLLGRRRRSEITLSVEMRRIGRTDPADGGLAVDRGTRTVRVALAAVIDAPQALADAQLPSLAGFEAQETMAPEALRGVLATARGLGATWALGPPEASPSALADAEVEVDADAVVVEPARLDPDLVARGERLEPRRSGRFFGYASSDTSFAIPPRYRDASPFSEGFAAVQVGTGKWGYIDAYGHTVVPFHFDSAFRFAEGWADAARHGHLERIPRPRAGNASSEPEKVGRPAALRPEAVELGAVLEPFRGADGRFGFRRGTDVLIDAEFDDADRFSEGLAAVRVPGQRWGYIDPWGRLVIEPVYDSAHRFADGWAEVGRDGEWSRLARPGLDVPV